MSLPKSHPNRTQYQTLIQQEKKDKFFYLGRDYDIIINSNVDSVYMDKSNIYTIDNLQVDIKTRSVYRGNVEIQLLPKEFTILAYMIQNQGIVLTREQLENQIWNLEYTGSSNNIDGYMYRLRKKIDIEGHCKLIHTIRGVGWVLRK